MRRGLLPRLQDFLFVLVLIGVITTGSRMLNIDSDLGRHLAMGGYILSSWRVPTTDILSFTRFGASRPPYEWLAQVLLAASYRAINLDGVVLLAAAIIAAAFSVVQADAVRRSGGPLLSLFIALWAALASSLHWLPRPHVFTFLFLALWLYRLESLRRGVRNSIWLFPALMLMWANTHGGFIFGFLALGCYLAGWFVDAMRGATNRSLGARMLAITGMCLIASVITPDLWHNWDAVLNNRSSYVLSQTIETMPLRLATANVWPFLGMLAAAVALVAVRRFRVPPAHLILLAVLAAASFVMVRNIPLFCIAAVPLLADWAAPFLRLVPIWARLEERFASIEATTRPHIWTTIAMILAITCLAVRFSFTRAPLFQFRQDIFPVQAADWARTHRPQGAMFNDFNWGGYLLYRLWPQQRVFIDSQSDFYGEQLTREAASIANGDPGWEELLDRYDVQWLLLPGNAGLVRVALSDPRWSVAYQDGTAIIFTRK